MAEEIIPTFFEVPVRDGGKVDATHIDLLLTHKASEAQLSGLTVLVLAAKMGKDALIKMILDRSPSSEFI